MIFFPDNSTLVKRYVAETGTGWIRNVIKGANKGEVVISKITGAEVAAAFSRRRRNGDISAIDYEKAVRAFEYHYRHEYLRIEVTDEVVNLAIELTKRRELRGYDAVQLATAVILDQEPRPRRRIGLTFISADGKLCESARAEGLTTEDPNVSLDIIANTWRRVMKGSPG